MVAGVISGGVREGGAVDAVTETLSNADGEGIFERREMTEARATAVDTQGLQGIS